MTTQIFVNLPVKDLPQAMNFWRALGYSFHPQFSDETAACLVFSEHIYAMLLTHTKFLEFSPLPICNTKTQTAVLLALSCESRKEVEEKMSQALRAGAPRYAEPRDLGFMYQDGFQDLDGHVWEIFWMDASAVEPKP